MPASMKMKNYDSFEEFKAMKTRCLFHTLTLTVCLAVLTASAEVKLPSVFADGMVLQQRSTITVWGWAAPEEKIAVKGSWPQLEGAAATADADGRWRVSLKTPSAGGPYTLSVAGENAIVLNDVLIGEVWVCSGQSNMQWNMKGLKTEEGKNAIAAADFPTLRQFAVPRTFSAVPQSDCQGQWQVCTPQTAGSFSAVAFYFGRELNQTLNIPIGLIYTSWGGTVAEAWTSAEALRAYGDFDAALDALATLDTSEQTARQEADRLLEQWEKEIADIDLGIKEGWQTPTFNDADWKTMELPSPWTGTELAKVDGIVWFRRITNLPPSWTRGELELRLGPIDDIDTVWVNGIRIGATNGSDKARAYRIPASALRVGPNVIAVRVVDTAREGGFTGVAEDMRIGPPGADIKAFATVAHTWKYKVSYKGSVPAVPQSEGKKKLNQNTPTALYNAMIHPLLPFRIAGAIWYQGESNRDRAMQYRTLFPAMIKDWRAQWGQGDFPFYYVQIAPYKYLDSNAPVSAFLREAQMLTLKALPNVGMAVTMDIGEENDIHPKNKIDVGKRLARWALAKDYGKDMAYSGPIYRKMKVQDGTVRLSFDYVGSGLVARGGALTGFEIAGSDQKFVPATAAIDGDEVVVSSDQVSAPAAVRYAFKNWAQPNLFNAEGLPASSFRTDDWPME